jgi:hypothetical protein
MVENKRVELNAYQREFVRSESEAATLLKVDRDPSCTTLDVLRKLVHG